MEQNPHNTPDLNTARDTSSPDIVIKEDDDKVIECVSCTKIHPDKIRQNYFFMTRYKYCEFCETDKPPRSHHCKYCNQ